MQRLYDEIISHLLSKVSQAILCLSSDSWCEVNFIYCLTSKKDNQGAHKIWIVISSSTHCLQFNNRAIN